MMPDVPIAWWAPIIWGALFVAGIAFWAYIGGPALFWAFGLVAGWL